MSRSAPAKRRMFARAAFILLPALIVAGCSSEHEQELARKLAEAEMEAAAAKAAQLAAERDAQALRARKAEQSYARFYGEAEAADDAGSKDLANEPAETAETVAPAEPAQPLSDFAKQAVGGDF